jgi:hypothetical protein
VIWCSVFFTIDFLFLIDVILSFFTSIPETEKKDEITDKKKIAFRYLKGWFAIDILSIMPFHVMFEVTRTYFVYEFCKQCAIDERSENMKSGGGGNIMLRTPKITKVVKIVQLMRMIKVIKLMKNKQQL